MKSATFKQEATGHWYLTFVSHFEMPDIEPTSVENPVGIDLGLEDFAAFSTGEKVKAPRYYRKSQQKIRRQARKVSRRFNKAKAERKEPQSKNYQKAKQGLARRYARACHQRNDFLHKLSPRTVREHDVICIADTEGLWAVMPVEAMSDSPVGAVTNEAGKASRERSSPSF